MSDPSRPTEPLIGVLAADLAVWSTCSTTTELVERDAAARAAVAAGWTAAEIAHRLGVRPEDVERWAACRAFLSGVDLGSAPA